MEPDAWSHISGNPFPRPLGPLAAQKAGSKSGQILREEENSEIPSREVSVCGLACPCVHLPAGTRMWPKARVLWVCPTQCLHRGEDVNHGHGTLVDRRSVCMGAHLCISVRAQ